MDEGAIEFSVENLKFFENFAVGDVGQPLKDREFRRFSDESNRTVSEQQLRAARMHAAHGRPSTQAA